MAATRTTGLRRLTVDLSERAHQALTATTELTGRAEADTVNRALVVYEWVMELKSDHQPLYVEGGSGGLHQVEIL